MRINEKTTLCMGCMRPLTKDGRCSYCHLDPKSYVPAPGTLLPGTKIADRYVLGKVLGQGSFGITYIAWDCILEIPVAIKEYYPMDLVRTDVLRGTKADVVIRKGTSEKYIYQLKGFAEESKCLIKFGSFEGIVSVRDFFCGNHTAYLVMEYVEGVSVKTYVEKQAPMSGDQVLSLMEPVLKSLEKIHKRGMIHRDISPDNLVFDEDGQLKLLDFGSARFCNRFGNREMTVSFKRGFSPVEQYREHTKQGPPTDIYAACATMYFMLTGHVPPEAVERMAGEELPSLISMDSVLLPKSAKKALMKGLSVEPEQRYQTMADLIKELYRKDEEKKVPVIQMEQPVYLWQRFFRTKRGKIIVGGLVMAAVLSFAFLLYRGNSTGHEGLEKRTELSKETPGAVAVEKSNTSVKETELSGTKKNGNAAEEEKKSEIEKKADDSAGENEAETTKGSDVSTVEKKTEITKGSDISAIGNKTEATKGSDVSTVGNKTETTKGPDVSTVENKTEATKKTYVSAMANKTEVTKKPAAFEKVEKKTDTQSSSKSRTEKSTVNTEKTKRKTVKKAATEKNVSKVKKEKTKKIKAPIADLDKVTVEGASRSSSAAENSHAKAKKENTSKKNSSKKKDPYIGTIE